MGRGYDNRNGWDDWYLQRRREIVAKDQLIRRKQEITPPQDSQEQQADEVAGSFIVGAVSQSQEILSKPGTEIARKEEVNAAFTSPEFDQQLQSSKGQGQKLEPGIKNELEAHTDADLSGVNVHTSPQAHEMTESIHAKAFTQGQDIYFKKGQYNPQSAEGRRLLAHEVTHTLQQGKGFQLKVQRQVEKEDRYTIYTRISNRFKIIIDKYNLNDSIEDFRSAEEMASGERLLTQIEPLLLLGEGYPTSLLMQGLRYDAWDGKNRLVIVDAPPYYETQSHMHSFDMDGDGLIFTYYRSQEADKAFDAYAAQHKPAEVPQGKLATAMPAAEARTSGTIFKSAAWKADPTLIATLAGTAPVLGYNAEKNSGSQGPYMQILHDNLMTLAMKWTIISDEEMQLDLFGPTTKQAVINYQLKNGIVPAAGNVGPKTLRKMDDELYQQEELLDLKHKVRSSVQQEQERKNEEEAQRTQHLPVELNSAGWVIYRFPKPDAAGLARYGIDASLITFTYIDRGSIEDIGSGGCRYEVRYKDVLMGTIDLQRDERGKNENQLFSDAYSGKNPAFRSLLENGKAFRFANSTSIDQKGDPDFISLLIAAGFPGCQTGFSAEDQAFMMYMLAMQTVVDVGGAKMASSQMKADAKLNSRLMGEPEQVKGFDKYVEDNSPPTGIENAFKPSGITHDFKFGASFESRHVASKISIRTSRVKENNTVALRSVNYKLDLIDINKGLAAEVSNKTYGKVYKLANGNIYYLENEVLKPLEGGGYVNLSRGAMKALGIMNDEGLSSPRLKVELGQTFSQEEYNKALDVYYRSR